MKIRRLTVGKLMVLLLGMGMIWQFPFGTETVLKPGEGLQATGLGDVKTLQAKYDRWKKVYRQDVGEGKLSLPLRYTKGLSAEWTQAQGKATFDLVHGGVSVQVNGLPEAKGYEVWLVDNRPFPGHSVKPDPADEIIHLGTLEDQENLAGLQTSLSPEILGRFQLDLVIVSPVGEDPQEAGLLFGSPSLFHRLFYNEERGRGPLMVDGEKSPSAPSSEGSLWSVPFRALIPSPAYAKKPNGPPSLQRLIAKGEKLFLNETFKGNGRTCGSCHRPENNFTIDPAFIATLPPDDALFIAENDPALSELEKPQLMRQFGLILENVDGLEDPTGKFVMRGTPHTLALPTSLDAGNGFQATGWSGDGAPSLTLLSFATGAVRQHFTKSLDRIPGKDFRFPTQNELVAMETFQLALGRQNDTNLQTLQLTGAVAQKGLEVFTSSGAGCNVCHVNAGATFQFNPGVNANFDTGVEKLTTAPATLVDPTIPCDGGRGTAENSDCGPANDKLSFGDGTFNTPPLVEAADTGPFFHNHSIATIEGAVAFYNSDAFNSSPSAVFFPAPINLDPTEIEAVGAFLRVINALENLRNAIRLEKTALGWLDRKRHANVDRLVKVSGAEVQDAIEVLSGVNLHLDAVAKLIKARELLEKANRIHKNFRKEKLIEKAIAKERAARDMMCEHGEVICEET